MPDVKMTTSFVAPLARRDKTTIYQWFNTPECQSWLPPKTGIGESRSFIEEQAVLLMIHSDLNRWGIPVPMAGRLTGRIAEEFATWPDVRPVTICFCENGASYCVAGSAREGKSMGCFRAPGAGTVRFALEIDVSGYRKTIREAVDAEPQVIGGDDEER